MKQNSKQIKEWEKKFIEEYKNKGWFIASEDQKPIIDFISYLLDKQLSQNSSDWLRWIREEMITDDEKCSDTILDKNRLDTVIKNQFKQSQRELLDIREKVTKYIQVEERDYDRAFIDAQFHDMIDKMWIDKEKNRYDVGWNSALAELEARLKLKQHQKKLLVKKEKYEKENQTLYHITR